MRIQHNIMAMSAYRNYTNNVSAMKKNLEKLSSGYKINRAGDDAAGLAISEKMRAQITGLETAQKNAKDGISLVQTAEGALTEVHDMLNRMVELATQSANGTYDNTTDRAQMQKEVNQLLEEIDRIADSSNFNGINLLDGTLGLNTDAFDVGTSTSYTPAASATDWVTASKVGTPHGGDTVSGVAPSFKIDLSNLEDLNIASATSTTQGTISLKVGTATITVNVGASSTVAQTIAASQVAAAFNNASATIGGMRFTITNTSGVLTFTATKASTDITASDVTGFKTAINGDVLLVNGTRTGGYASANNPTNVNHDVLDLVDPVANEPGGRLGVDIDISDLIADGNTLTIDGKTFTFHIGSTATNANSSTSTDIYIDTNKFTSASAVKREAARLLSHKDTTNFDIEFDQASGKIHIDAKATATVTKAEMLAGISGKIAGAPEQVANTKLTIDEGALKEGNVISVDGKKFVFKGAGSNGFADIAELVTKLGQAGHNTTVATASDGKKVLTIEGASKDAEGSAIAAKDRVAPTILGKGLTLQIGDTSDSWNQLNVAVQDMHAESIGVGNLDISTEEAAQAAIKSIKAAINTVSDVRGTLGATQNRLDHTINNLSVMTENIQDAESTIRDVDVAEEMMAYTKNNILIQSAQAMLAQANQVPQGVLQLLQ